MKEKYRDRDPYINRKFSKEPFDSRRDYIYHRTNDHHINMNKNTYSAGRISSDTPLQSPRYSNNARFSVFDRDSNEHLDRRKEYLKTPFKSTGSKSFEHFLSSKHDSSTSPREKFSHFTSRSPSPRSDNQKTRNFLDSRYHSSLPHSPADSTYKMAKDQISYGSLSVYKGENLPYRQSSVGSSNLSVHDSSFMGFRNHINTSSRENLPGSLQQSRLYKNPSNTLSWEMSTRIFISPVEEQEKEFLRLNQELSLLDEKSKGVLKEKRLSMFEWQKLVYKSEREAKNVELAEKQLEAAVNGFFIYK
ncbi:hypothetical protein PMAC_002415 [Pneumocystis sp. 'macacae']|nr:hypothetical protein PMAC_002415 [Pneumocystis sp. 'macacae']